MLYAMWMWAHFWGVKCRIGLKCISLEWTAAATPLKAGGADINLYSLIYAWLLCAILHIHISFIISLFLKAGSHTNRWRGAGNSTVKVNGIYCGYCTSKWNMLREKMGSPAHTEPLSPGCTKPCKWGCLLSPWTSSSSPSSRHQSVSYQCCSVGEINLSRCSGAAVNKGQTHIKDRSRLLS